MCRDMYNSSCSCHEVASFLFLMLQEWDLSSDGVRDTVSTTTSARGGEVAHSAPLGENSHAWTRRARDQKSKKQNQQ